MVRSHGAALRRKVLLILTLCCILRPRSTPDSPHTYDTHVRRTRTHAHTTHIHNAHTYTVTYTHTHARAQLDDEHCGTFYCYFVLGLALRLSDAIFLVPVLACPFCFCFSFARTLSLSLCHFLSSSLINTHTHKHTHTL